MSTLCYRGKSVDIELNFHVNLLNFDLNYYTPLTAVKFITIYYDVSNRLKIAARGLFIVKRVKIL